MESQRIGAEALVENFFPRNFFPKFFGGAKGKSKRKELGRSGRQPQPSWHWVVTVAAGTALPQRPLRLNLVRMRAHAGERERLIRPRRAVGFATTHKGTTELLGASGCVSAAALTGRGSVVPLCAECAGSDPWAA